MFITAPILPLLWLTSVTFAQIGIDNVDEPVTTNIIEVNTQYLTQDPTFGGSIGVNTQYLTEENGVTKWIGVNTQYLTQITATTTNSQGSTMTSTQDVKATVVGDPPVDGVLGADLSVVVTPEFLSEVNSIKAEFCPIKKRALTCGIEFVDKVAASFDIYAAADAAKWGAALLGGIGIKRVGAMYAAQAKKIAEGGKDIPLKMDINKDDFNKANPVITKIITMTKQKPSPSSTESTATGGPGKGGTAGSTATAVPECWLYTGSSPDLSDINDPNGNPALVDIADDPPTKLKRLASRATHDVPLRDDNSQSLNPAMIMKRENIGLSHLGSCPQNLPSDFKLIMSYPSVTNVKDDKKKGLPHEQWWFIPQPNGDSQLCTVYTLQQVPKDKLQGNLPQGYDQTPGSSTKKSVSIDHIYEKSFLKDFFNSAFTDPNDPRCQPFLDMFLQQTKYTDPRSSKIPQFSRLQTLFYLTPNRANGAFLGLDQNINDVKGKLMNPGLRDIQKIETGKDPAATEKNLNLWNDIAMAWSILKIPVAQAKFKQVNKDIYQGFLAIDKLQSCESIKGIGNTHSPQTWASAYQDWMTSFLRQRQSETVNYVASITSAIEAAPSTTTEPGGQTKNKFGHAFEGLAKQFPEEFYQLDTNALLDFSGDPIDKIQKRDNSVIGFPACSTTNTALPTDLPKLSTFATSATSKTTISKPTFTPPQPPPYNGGPRPDWQLQCVDKNMAGIKSVDRRIAIDAINLGCGSPTIRWVAPVDKFNMSKVGYQDGDHSKPSQYVHMTHRYSQNQDGCQPMVPDHNMPKWGVTWEQCQATMLYILDNCDTNTVTDKYGGAGRWNAPNGCIDLDLWIPDGPDLAPPF